MWINTESDCLNDLWSDIDWSGYGIVREDCTDHVWVNLEEGATLALVCDGGWRMPNRSRYRLFFRRIGETQITEITEPILWPARNGGRFDSADGADAYMAVTASCQALIDSICQASSITAHRASD